MSLSARITRFPWSILLLSAALMVVGLVAVHRSETLAETSGRLFWQQLIFAALAVTAMLAATAPNYRILCRWSYLALVVALVLLVTVFLFPKINGSHRWIRLGSVGLQPSEFAKVAFVLALSRWLMHRDNYRRLSGLLIPLGLTILPVLLILREPDLGTALVFLPVLIAMLFAAGARRRDLTIIMATGLLLMPLLWTQMSREQKSRVTAMLDQSEPDERPSDDQYHLHRAKQTLAMGGFWGTWISDQSSPPPGRYLVPAAATDSIICIVGERFGLLGIAVTLLLYAWLVARCLSVAQRTQEPFGRMLCVGVAALIAVQVLINTSMMVGMLPITGLSLPLISYGGSGLLSNALALGLVLNVGLRPGFEVAGEPFRFVTQKRAA